MTRLAINGGNPIREKPFPQWPFFEDEDKVALLEVLESGKWGTLGPRAKEFQEKFASFIGTEHGLCVANGTVSLEIALRAMEIGPGDEVIIPPYTFVATASSILTAGATPIFADINPDHFNCIEASSVADAINENTKAIIPVHMGGCPADMDPLIELAGKHDLWILEDAAQAHGAEYKGCKVGSIGNAASFSFQESKNLASGEGGILTTSSSKLWERSWSIHNTGRSLGGEWYQHEQLGSNYRMTEWQAAVLLGQLKRLPQQMEKREKNARILYRMLEEVEEIELFPLRGDFRYAWHLFMFKLQKELVEKVGKVRFAQALTAEGIPTSTGYINLADQKLFQTELVRSRLSRPIDYPALELPATRQACEVTLWFPQNLLLGDESDIEDIAAAIVKVIENRDELV